MSQTVGDYPLLWALYCLDGVIGVVTHVRGFSRKPGGFSEPVFNIRMGRR